MHKLQLILLSTAFCVPSLFANKGKRAAFFFTKAFASRPQPIDPRPAKVTPKIRAKRTGRTTIAIKELPLKHESLDQPIPRSTRTFPLCSPTTPENPIPRQNFEIYKSIHGTFAYFVATIQVKESLGRENRTREQVIVFYDNAGAQKVMETANELIAECPRVLDASISWQLVEYDTQEPGGNLDDLD